jgi:hypothetical protein
MPAKVSIEPKSLAQFVEACRQFAEATGISMRDAVLEQAMLACQDAARFTPPLALGGGNGLSPAAKKAGLNAVAGDISKIFVAANDSSARGVAGNLVNQMAFAVKSGDFGTFSRLTDGGRLSGMLGQRSVLSKIANDTDKQRAFAKAKNFLNRANPIKSEYGTQGFVRDLRPIHNQVKGKFGGRIKKGRRPVVAKLLVQDKAEIQEYVLRRQQMVGAIKSGWAKALASLPRPDKMNGQKGEPGAELRKATWVTMHSNVPGTNMSTFTDKVAEVSVTNTLGNINGIADEAGVLGLVYGNRVKQMPAMIRYRLRQPINKFNRK